MARTVATTTVVPLPELLDFVRERRHLLLATARSDGRPQLSPVSGGIDGQGRLIISTYPGRAKTANIKRTPEVSVVVLSDDWDGPWVQIDGTAEVLDMPAAEDALVDYYRSLAGEHPDWDEYRAAMRLQNKSLIRITPTRWGPLATGGFPADIASRLDARDAAGAQA
jgi:PPOX class probable F420-dependent enzyme